MKRYYIALFLVFQMLFSLGQNCFAQANLSATLRGGKNHFIGRDAVEGDSYFTYIIHAGAKTFSARTCRLQNIRRDSLGNVISFSKIAGSCRFLGNSIVNPVGILTKYLNMEVKADHGGVIRAYIFSFLVMGSVAAMPEIGTSALVMFFRGLVGFPPALTSILARAAYQTRLLGREGVLVALKIAAKLLNSAKKAHYALAKATYHEKTARASMQLYVVYTKYLSQVKKAAEILGMQTIQVAAYAATSREEVFHQKETFAGDRVAIYNVNIGEAVEDLDGLMRSVDVEDFDDFIESGILDKGMRSTEFMHDPKTNLYRPRFF